ncbi:unnamed protein product [Notodromas monacha]|uniref:RNA/RNP complex-1-interacting phosphatase n=1 Tax=Notodromas monacha TaxID=399045 RepID=A0A7R9BUP5_9CRUS|nr:unnamed protein product [Notodromas monacha]CAG0920543.1 unnamed protein product [Notodromas monacha]
MEPRGHGFRGGYSQGQSKPKAKNNSVPDRWLDYSNFGRQIHGTPIVALKVPLRAVITESVEIANKVPEDKRFGPTDVLEQIQNLGMVLDLTATQRYYDPQFFMSQGIRYFKLVCEGRVIPGADTVRAFFAQMDGFRNDPGMRGCVIGVHCTHGVNRTGYLICRYMIQRLGLSAQEAIQKFEAARGHKIERPLYVDHLSELGCTSVQPSPRYDGGSSFRGGAKVPCPKPARSSMLGPLSTAKVGFNFKFLYY